MAGRGRGGGGRGRGRASLSFNVEQLGLAPGEILPGPVLQPPPLFPPIEFRPAPLLDTPFHVSQLQLKADFHDYFTRSSAFIQTTSLTTQSEQFADAGHTTVLDKPFVTDWLCVPPELKPTLGKKKRKAGSSTGVVSKKIHKEKIANLNSWLEALEKKESIEDVKEKEPGDSGKKKNEEEQERDPNDELEEEDVDEEMDDGTDYNQNYFDNGEGYLDDEDDNLDDGPIY